MYRRYLFITFSLLSSSFFAQIDSTAVEDTTQLVDEVYVIGKGQVVFDNDKLSLVDFYVDENATILLLKSFQNYFLAKLDYDNSFLSTIQLNFRPQSLFYDCMKNLNVVSGDSIYKIEFGNSDIAIYEPNSISFFYDYYLDCKAQSNQHLIYRALLNENQTTVYYGIKMEEGGHDLIYKTQDPNDVLVAKDWREQITSNNYSFQYQMGEINEPQLSINRRKFQDLQFFNFIISKPNYTPIYIVDSSIYIFDHNNDYLVVIDPVNLVVEDTIPINYHKIRGWRSQLIYDYGRNTFYTLFLERGVLSIAELSSSTFEIVEAKKLLNNSYPRRIMVSNGFVYYDFTPDREDTSFRKLYKERF